MMRYAIVDQHPAYAQEPTMTILAPLKSLAPVALAATVLLAGCESLSPRVYDYRVMKVDHVAGSPLEIVNANGSIRAYQEARQDVAIEVELFGKDEERLDFATVHADRQGDRTLRVWIDWPGGKRHNGEGAKIEVFTPGATNVNTKTSNGSVILMGLAGQATVHTSNGSIHVDKHDGPVNANTSNGAIRVEETTGDIQFDTSNGRIIISDAMGAVEGDTSNGNIFVSTTDYNTSPIRVRTSNGRVELDLGYAFEGILRVSTSNGRIKTDGLTNANLVESSNHTLELQVGNSDTISAVKTTNGSVRIHGRSDD